MQGETTDAHATDVARILLRNKPAIAIGAGPVVARLNAILASVGHSGGFLPRRDFTPVTDIASVPDGSIRVLLIEETAGGEALPWDLLRRKLAPQNPVLVALTPWLDGCAQHADYVIPAPMYLESLDEAPTPAGSTVAGFSLAPALLAAPPKLTPPAEFVLRLAHDSATYPDILKQRVAAIRRDGRGAVFTYPDAKSTRVRDIPDLWKIMLSGALWQDDPLPSGAGSKPAAASQAALLSPLPPTPEYPLILIAAGTPPPHGSPLMSKLYRESGLRRPATSATMNPKTGRDHGLADACRAIVTSPAATIPVQVIFDPAVMPGVIEMAGQAVSPASIRRA